MKLRGCAVTRLRSDELHRETAQLRNRVTSATIFLHPPTQDYLWRSSPLNTALHRGGAFSPFMYSTA